MNFLQKKLVDLLGQWRTTGTLQVVYALAVEALLIGYIYFIGLFTVETLLPTFITVRLSLTKFFFLLTLATFLLSLLGRFLNLSFPWNITKKSPLLWLGIIWSIGILTVSLIKFPLPIIPLLIAGFLLSGYLFWSIFFEEK
ncbi:MAG: hypothetical protein WA082_02215 [Candidatus Moraniibacteriota bacterium]